MFLMEPLEIGDEYVQGDRSVFPKNSRVRGEAYLANNTRVELHLRLPSSRTALLANMATKDWQSNYRILCGN